MLTVSDVVAEVQRAADEILSLDERSDLRISVIGQSRSRVNRDDEPGDNGAHVQVAVLGEELRIWVDFNELPSSLFARARSDLQDFVAESSFGWGQWRE